MNRKQLEWDESLFKTEDKADLDLETDNLIRAEKDDEIVTLNTSSTMYYLKQPKLLINLIIMCIVWLTTSFGYYLILSLINTFESVYITGFVSSFSEMVAYILAGMFYLKVGVKLSLIIAFAISTTGGILILSWGLDHQDSALFFVFFLLAKFGVAANFNIAMTANSYFFPTLFAATALGMCNFSARILSALSYPISTLEEPMPMIIFTVL